MLTTNGFILLRELERVEADEAAREAEEIRRDADQVARNIYRRIMAGLRKKKGGERDRFVIGYSDFAGADGDWAERNLALGRLLGISFEDIPRVPHDSEDRRAPAYKYELTREELIALLRRDACIPPPA